MDVSSPTLSPTSRRALCSRRTKGLVRLICRLRHGTIFQSKVGVVLHRFIQATLVSTFISVWRISVSADKASRASVCRTANRGGHDNWDDCIEAVPPGNG
jgi:hypothetical protein